MSNDPSSSSSSSSASSVQPQANQQAGDPASQAPKPTSPGDDAPAGTPGTGENVCPQCGGSGKADGGSSCPTCDGTGKVTTGIGGA